MTNTQNKETGLMLKNKVAVIYGAGGAIGSAVARAFAREGAKLFLTGRHRAPVEVVAKDIVSAGGCAEAAEVPIATYTTSYFVTARLAARRMLANRSGVIMTVTAITSRTGVPLVGGRGPAMAAVEALTRGLSTELAPQGIRVVGLRPQGMPETGLIKEAFALYAKAQGVRWEQFLEVYASRTHPRRLTTLAEMTNVAVFMASDKASGMTGTIVNLSMGSLDD